MHPAGSLVARKAGLAASAVLQSHFLAFPVTVMAGSPVGCSPRLMLTYIVVLSKMYVLSLFWGRSRDLEPTRVASTHVTYIP